jgi:N,N-dimethylformamidase beta subunit-like, C-terminal/Domain of unknown function (DUF4082)/Fibronectin type III domain/Bacterial Ig domain
LRVPLPHHPPVRPAVSAFIPLALILLALGLVRAPAAAASCGNPVQCENQLRGDSPGDWEIDGAGDSSIQGFATAFSVDAGQTEYFKIDTPSTAYHIDILRIGYYGGDGARLIASDIKPSVSLPQTQPACLTDSSNGLIDCGNWAVSASWTVPSDAVSGVYIAHLVRDDSKDPGGDSQIPFVVRNDDSHSDVVVATSDATWEAYNDYGGNSLYTCSVACPPGNPEGYKAAYGVSYNRPFDGSFTTDGGSSYLYYAEFQLIYWLEENGYDVTYVSDSDLDRDPGLLLNHKIFISSGHDEYWSGNERAGVAAALADGVSLAFFSGNEVFWKTRWANSEDGSNTPYRTLMTYKETHFNAPVDPEDPPTWTGAWADPRFSPPADGGVPANALTGQEFLVNSGSGDMTVPSQYSKLQFWRNTAAAKLGSGQTLTLAPGCDTLGYEWDVDADNGSRPAGEFDMSGTTLSGTSNFEDYGTTVATGSATHHLTLYRAPSGAWVFGAGTVQWSWGLDEFNGWNATGPPSGCTADPTMQQATVNLLAIMGAQPTTLMGGLVPGSPTTNTTPPQSSISSPAAGANLQDGSQVTVSGSASASGGNVVAGVEVSTDGGSTWHPATITGPDAQTVNWAYTWTATGYPATQIESRAVDDGGNLETPSDGVSVQVNCPCSLWGNVEPATAVPYDPNSVDDSGDSGSIELGVKFQSSVYGEITGIRFYKSAANTGTHVGSLWTASGQLLASATFTSETASGWQTVTFANPVTILPDTTYVAAYFAPNGHYSATDSYFYGQPAPTPIGGAITDSPPLQAVANSSSVNGLYSYTSSSAFPSNSYSASNYWVDPTFMPIPSPGQVTSVSASAGYDSASVTWNAPSSGGAATTYTVTPYSNGTAGTPVTVTGTPPSTSATVNGLQQGVPYTFTVQASNPNGSGPASAASNAITPTGPAAPAAPTGVTASPASNQALVSWTAPASNGSAITGYTITPYIGPTPQTPVQVISGSVTSASVTGLQNGTSYSFSVSATNDLGTGPTSAVSTSVTPEDTILDFGSPGTVDSGDASSVELGVKFTASTSGSVTGIRFYKSANNTGTHVGSLWNSSGTLLASATFTNETASGWQYASFATPVQLTAGQTYVAGYLAPNGHYSGDSGGLSSGVTNAPLQALPNGASANGVYAYASASTFPTNTYRAYNYWVDVLFAPTPPGAISNLSATAGHLSAAVTWSAPPSGGVTSYTVTPYLGSTAQTPVTVTGSPAPTTATITGLTAGASYTFTVQASNAQGSGPVSANSNAVTPTAPTAPAAPTNVMATPASSQALVTWTPPANNGSPLTGYTVTPYLGSTADTPVQVSSPTANSVVVPGLTNGTSYTFTVSATNGIGTGPASDASTGITPEDTIFDFSTPATLDSGDTSPVEVGVKFSADWNGTVTGIRFYKAPDNTGTHVGNLWTAGGTLLASATFTNETASGWQYALFSSPVQITAGTTYVASYFAPSGHYSYTSNGFASSIDNPPLHALAGSTSANGVYSYSSTSTFPSSTYGNTNYGVDVLYQPPAPSVPSAPTNVSASPATGQALVSWTPPASNGSDITGYTITPYIGSTAQTSIQVNSGTATSATVTGLSNGTPYTFTVAAINGVGTGQPSASTEAVTPADTLFDFSSPQTVDSGDTSSIELGVKFTPTTNGTITGIRFYKASDNSGTHIGNLWSLSGTLLASGTFSTETASGWQYVLFSSPVAVTAGTTYVASYFAPNGHYSVSPNGLGATVTNGPLQTIASSVSPDGVYTYSSTSAFPTSSYGSSNYWVDVLFATS